MDINAKHYLLFIKGTYNNRPHQTLGKSFYSRAFLYSVQTLIPVVCLEEFIVEVAHSINQSLIALHGNRQA